MDESGSFTGLRQRKQRGKGRFRHYVHLVIHNLNWLSDDDTYTVGGGSSTNVRRNVHKLTKERKSNISIQEKAILNKPAEWRTDDEKNFINKILGNMKCFRKFPDHVRMDLAGVARFAYFEANRIIVKQGHIAWAMYCVLSGAANITSVRTDANNLTQVHTAVLTSGDSFGEVALFHELPRTETVVTNVSTEFLVVDKVDFDRFLKNTIKEQWDKLFSAMRGFTYFDDWAEDIKRECTVHAKLKSFNRHETIVGDGQGLSNWIYFVVKGQCRVIEHLLVYAKKCGKKKVYTFLSSADAALLKEEKTAEIEVTPENEEAAEAEAARASEDARKVSILSRATVDAARDRRSTMRHSDISFKGKQGKLDEAHKRDTIMGGKKSIDADNENQTRLRVSGEGHDMYENVCVETSFNLPSGVEEHFLQVCTFSDKACFSKNAKYMHRRRVIAVTNVDMLMIPVGFLNLRAKSQIWRKIMYYLETHIPTSEMVFEEFVEQRKWRQYKKEYYESLIRKTLCNTIHNVPYSIRIRQDFEFNEMV